MDLLEVDAAFDRNVHRVAVRIKQHDCCAADKWCSEVNPSAFRMREVAVPKFTIELPGNPGRWRVCAIDARG